MNIGHELSPLLHDILRRGWDVPEPFIPGFLPVVQQVLILGPQVDIVIVVGFVRGGWGVIVEFLGIEG